MIREGKKRALRGFWIALGYVWEGRLSGEGVISVFCHYVSGVTWVSRNDGDVKERSVSSALFSL